MHNAADPTPSSHDKDKLKFMRLIHRASLLLFVLLSFSIFAAAQSGKYTVQLGAAPTQAEADEKVKELKAKNIEAYILKSQVPGKGTFFRVRVGLFANANEARKYGAYLQQQGVVREYFVAPFEQTKEEIALSSKSAAKPTPVASNPAAVASSAPPINKETAKGKEKEPARIENLPKPAVKETKPAPAPTLPAGASFTRFRDPVSGFSFEYPSHWNGNSLSADDAKAQRINAGALFQSSKDSAFLSAIWNELDKANSPTNDNDLIVDVIMKSMRSGEGTRAIDEVERKVIEDKQKGQIKTYLDLRATFQQEQTAALAFIGKAVIIRTGKGILLVATFYSKDSRPEVAAVAEKVIASVKAPE